MHAELLSPRALNRAVLERQLLLRRADLAVVPAVERVLGLNAQAPNPPYIALWSRLERFTTTDLTRRSRTGRWSGRPCCGPPST